MKKLIAVLLLCLVASVESHAQLRPVFSDGSSFYTVTNSGGSTNNLFTISNYATTNDLTNTLSNFLQVQGSEGPGKSYFKVYAGDLDATNTMLYLRPDTLSLGVSRSDEEILSGLLMEATGMSTFYGTYIKHDSSIISSNGYLFSGGNPVSTNIIDYVVTNDTRRIEMTNANVGFLGGYTASELAAKGSVFYFSTNIISHGAVTGRETTLSLPLEDGMITYPGPVTNGQPFGTYLIASNDMPDVMEEGIYIATFFGGQIGPGTKDVKIHGDLVVREVSDGSVVQVFHGTPADIPKDTNSIFQMECLVTNRVIKNSYTWTLETHVEEADGYSKDFASYFGPSFLPHFTWPSASGIWTSKGDFSAHTNLSLSVGAHGGEIAGTWASNRLINIAEASREAMGVSFGATFQWDFDNSTTTLTATAAAPWTYWHKGYVSPAMGNITTQLIDQVGTHYLYFDAADGELRESMTPWNFSNVVQFATVYWDGSRGLVGAEPHGMTMDWASHEYLHDTIRTRYESGLSGSYGVNAMTTTAGVAHDEDLVLTIPPTTNCTLLYHVASTLKLSELSNVPYLTSGGIIVYDNLTTTNAVAAGQYVASWIFVGNSPSNPILSVVGQRVDSTLANARANNTIDSLSLSDLPSQEMKILYRVIFHRASGTGTLIYDETQDLRSVSLVPSTTFIPTAHGSLSGLSLDDHPQYALVAGGRPSAEATAGSNEAYRISGGTNALATDITNRVAGVGYLLPPSTQHLVTASITNDVVAKVDTNGWTVSSHAGFLSDGTLYATAAQGIAATNAQTRVGLLEGATNGLYVRATNDAPGKWVGKATGPLDMQTNMIINTGPVGVGVTNPQTTMVIDSSSNTNAVGYPSIIVQGTSNKERLACRGAQGGFFYGNSFSGSLTSMTAGTEGQSSGFGGGAFDGAGWFQQGYVLFILDETWGTTNRGMHCELQTTPVGSSTRTARLKITSSGAIQLIPASVSPTAVNGGLYYDSDDNKYYGCTSTVWKAFTLAP